jgi:nucleoside-diphosphate-sugar epimerase
MRFLMPGAAGFNGTALCEQLKNDGDRIIELDCCTDSYEARRKLASLSPSGSTGARRPKKSRT